MTRTRLGLLAILITPLMLLIALACSNGPATDTPSPGITNPSSSKAANTADAPTSGGAAPAESRTGGKTSVVTTNNIVADWARAVGRDRVDVFSLLPGNADPHTFQPGARDIARVADADLVLSVGLSLEATWLDELVTNAAQNSNGVVAIGDYVDPIDFVEIFEEHEEYREREERREHEENREHEEGHDHDARDPHFWFDPQRVSRAVDVIADQLSALDPEGRSYYLDNAAAYNRELDELHAWIQQEVAKLPKERRLLVTSHDSFQYFAQRYGFQVVGAVMPVTTEREPTAQELAALVETIEREDVPAVFAEKSHSQRLAKRIAEETGASLIGGLYTGSLGEPGGDAGTYIDLMRYNVRTIVEALQLP